jgi:hypothetical protein
MYVSPPVILQYASLPFIIRLLQFSHDPGLYLSQEPSFVVGMLRIEQTQSSPEWMQNLHVRHF